jgi:predicted NUDIX family phosphoesterase
MKQCFVIPSNKVLPFYGFVPGREAIKQDAVGTFQPRYEGAAVEYDSTFQQLIPYAVVRSKDGRILSYRRPSSGDEERLRGQLSIGIGGHIEPADAEKAGFVKDDVNNLWQLIVAAGEREAREEAGIHTRKTGAVLLGVIRNTDTEVGSVHTGVLILVDGVDEATITPNEELHEVTWRTLEELHKLVTDDDTPEDEPGLEHWSEIAVRVLTVGRPKPPPKPEPEPVAQEAELAAELPQLDERGFAVDDRGHPVGHAVGDEADAPDHSDSPEQIEARGLQAEDLTGGQIADGRTADQVVTSDVPTQESVTSDVTTQETPGTEPKE